MITFFTRGFTWVCALSGAALLSQYPAFSQAYLQRLAGQVDALAVVTADFDRSAQEAGMTRDEALGALDGTTFLDARQEDMQRTFQRYDRLTTALDALRAATPGERLMMPQNMIDRGVLEQARADFEPALPVSNIGFFTCLVGFLLGWWGSRALFGILSALWRMLFGRSARMV
jgi:hypothetical protein